MRIVWVLSANSILYLYHPCSILINSRRYAIWNQLRDPQYCTFAANRSMLHKCVKSLGLMRSWLLPTIGQCQSQAELITPIITTEIVPYYWPSSIAVIHHHSRHSTPADGTYVLPLMPRLSLFRQRPSRDDQAARHFRSGGGGLIVSVDQSSCITNLQQSIACVSGDLTPFSICCKAYESHPL